MILINFEEGIACQRRSVPPPPAAVEIPPNELLVFDIEADPPERLCGFVGVSRDYARFWVCENATMNPLGRFLARNVPKAVKRRVPRHWKRPVKNWLAKVKPHFFQIGFSRCVTRPPPGPPPASPSPAGRACRGPRLRRRARSRGPRAAHRESRFR